MRRSKRYRAASEKVDRRRAYALEEAVRLLKEMDRARFDETLEIALSLSIDPRQSDQAVRGTISLPKGTGRSLQVAVFADGEAAEQAREAGADVVGGEDLVQRVSDGWMDFDVAIATPKMMQHVRRLGRLLGPKGKMPSPRAGTVTDDVATAVREFKQGKIEYRNDDTGNVHAPLGKMSFPVEDLVANAHAFIEQIVRTKPAAAKGRYIKRASLSTSMGPGLRLDL